MSCCIFVTEKSITNIRTLFRYNVRQGPGGLMRIR